MKGFKAFIMRGNVVELAVAIIIGTAFGLVIKALVNDILTPLIAAIAGKPSFEALSFTVHKSVFLYGDVLNAVISFLSVAAAVYFFVILPLNKMAERRARGIAPADEVVPEDIALLTEIRDLLANSSPTPPSA